MIQAEKNAGLSCTDDVLSCGVRDSGGSPSDKDKWLELHVLEIGSNRKA